MSSYSSSSSSSSSSCASIDDTIGPYALDCRNSFDFTLLFEETVLCIVPIIVLLLITPLRFLHLHRERSKVVESRLLLLKLISFLVFAILQLVLLVLWARPSGYKTRASVPAAVLSFLSSLALCLLSYVEHIRTVRPSVLLDVYLFTSLLFDIPRARTIWLQGYGYAIAVVFTTSIVLKFFLLVLEVKEKRRILRPQFKSYPPEATSGIFNKFFFLWQNSLFRKGFSNSITVDDLFVLDKHLTSDYLQDLLQSAWYRVKDKATKGPHSLFFVTLKTLKWPLFSVIFPRLCLTAFNFAQPFLISSAVDLSVEPINSWTTNSGYGLIGAYIFVYVGIAVSTGQYQHLAYRAITMARGGLISMLYNKTADLSITSVDPANSLTLMSADIERITTGWQTMHEIWANLIEVALAIWLLQRQLGVACVIPIAVSLASLIGSLFTTSLVMSRQALWLEAMERRITATTSMLGAMKGVKMCGLTDVLRANLQHLRLEEIRISKKFRSLLVWNLAFAYFSPVVAPVLTFAVFSLLARNGNNGVTLDTSKMFTSLSLFALLTEPLATLIMSVATFMGAVGSFNRIQAFLDTEARIDNREKPLYLLSDAGYQSSDTQPSSDDSGIIDSDKMELRLAVKGKARDRYGPMPSDASVIVHNGTFGWDKEKDPLLRSISMTIPRGKLTILVGPVGCGKSTLLKAILGEIPTMEGAVQMSSLSIAYCDQSPWHTSGTVQQSIIAFSDFEERWYATVIRACALDEDLQQLPRGDQTMIGGKGIALSGGQSQRLALARAIYARKEIVILDDVLSGLDAGTENEVFNNLLGPQGLLRKQRSTVIIASSSIKRLPSADYIVAIDTDGRVSEQGTFEQLKSTGGYVSTFSITSTKPTEAKQEEEDLGSASEDTYEFKAPVVNALEKAIEIDSSRRQGDFSIYIYYIQAIGWLPSIFFLVCIMGYVFGLSFPNVWVNWWAAANAIAPNANLGYWLGIYGALGAVALGGLMISCWQIMLIMVPKSAESFHWKLLTTVLNAPMSFFATTDTGITLNRFSQDLQLIDMDLPIAALNTTATLILCMAQMILIGITSVYAAISFPICILTLFLIQKFYLRTSRQMRFLDLEAKSPLYSQFVECLSGLATVRAFGWQSIIETKAKQFLDRSQRPFYLLFAIQRWLTLILDLVVAAIAVLLIVLVVELRGTLSAGYVGVALLNVILFSQNLKLVLTFWTTLETHIGAISRIKIFTNTSVSENLPEENLTPPPTWPSRGAVEFEAVSASYRPSELVVKNVTLSVHGGQKIGICGRSGSGKSSLISCIFRMMELESGTITIDGHDLSTLPRQEIRSRIIGVSQDAYLLIGSVRLNADPTQSVSDKAITDALKTVNLWEVINEKGGLDADIDAIFLSHGQKQLFCLARAILRPSTILILDEATSSVDAKTDELMQRVIRQKFSRHTIIAVAHRLDTILDFDKVALMDKGNLIEYDSPNALLKRQSAFKQLYDSSVAD